jgi:peroxiredoxin Q/BCP
MLSPGSLAPEFSLPDQDGQTVTLTGLLTTGPLILYFYPADFTPGCTKQACAVRDLSQEIQATPLRVVGVSPQSSKSHRDFRAKYELPFTLLADESKSVVKAYDVSGPFGLGVRRATFLIDRDRHIRDAVLADLRIGRHEEFIRNAMRLGETR